MTNSSNNDSPEQTQIHEQICSPGYVRGIRINETTAILTWDEPYSDCPLCPNAQGYEVSAEGLPTKSIVRPPCEVTGLLGHVEYMFYVVAKAAGNIVSAPSPYRIRKVTLPSAPSELEVTELRHDSVKISWLPSAQHGSGVVTYKVYLNTHLVAQVDEPTCDLAHLRSYTDYTVEVRAANSAGVSEPVSAIFKTLLSPPANLRFSQRNGRCSLAWNPVLEVQPQHEVSINGQLFSVNAGKWAYHFAIGDVSPGPEPHHLAFEVHATIDGERSEVSRLEYVVDDATPPDTPGKPVASDITDNGATVTWDPVADNIGVAGYRVILNWFFVFETVLPTYTFNKLVSGAMHYVSVRALDKAGNISPFSKIGVFKTTGEAPVPPPSKPVLTLRRFSKPHRGTMLEWSQPEEGPGPMGIRVIKNGEHHMTTMLSVPLPEFPEPIDWALDVYGYDLFGQLSEPTSFFFEGRDNVKPTVPLNLREAGNLLTSSTLAWNASADNIGVNHYVIYNDHEYFDRTYELQYTAKNLMPGTHVFNVCAMDDAGNASLVATLPVTIDEPS